MKKISLCAVLLLSIIILCSCGQDAQQAAPARTPSSSAYADLLQKAPTPTPSTIPDPTPKPIPTPEPTPIPTPRNDKIQDIDISAETGAFSSSDKIQFSIYLSIQDLSHKEGWYVTQNNNPEVSFDEAKQELSFVRFYLTYYGECTKAEARTAVEDYTETILQALRATYPKVTINTVNICWKIPAIDEQSLYAATFWCEYDGTDLVLGDGTGIIYK